MSARRDHMCVWLLNAVCVCEVASWEHVLLVTGKTRSALRCAGFRNHASDQSVANTHFRLLSGLLIDWVPGATREYTATNLDQAFDEGGTNALDVQYTRSR